MPFHIILLHPEIPPNTGNIIRLTANTGCRLHLVKPLGFTLEDKHLRRAGLDYHDFADVAVHECLADAYRAAGDGRRFALTAGASARYDRVRYQSGDILLFGRESTGLPPEALDSFPEARKLFVPMTPQSRSFNLSNAVAVVVLEGWRQLRFIGAASHPAAAN